MSVGRRCSLCSTDWPNRQDYEECPECQVPTSRMSDLDPLSLDDAKSRKLHAEFERFYEDWDAEHDPARLEPDAEDAPAASSAA